MVAHGNSLQALATTDLYNSKRLFSPPAEVSRKKIKVEVDTEASKPELADPNTKGYDGEIA